MHESLRHVENRLACPEASGKAKHRERGPVAHEILLAVAAGTAEAVDGLIRVAYGEKALAIGGQEALENGELKRGAVLNLVHEQVQGFFPVGKVYPQVGILRAQGH